MAESHAEAAQPPAAEMVCKLCNRKVAASDGRKHGRFFRCLPCASIERAMRRNLGTAAEIGAWSHADCHSFFQKLHEEKRDNGNLQWATIRAVLKRRMTERKISSFASTTEVTPLPLSVLLAQGWEEDVVKKFESEKSDTYGWRDMFESVEEKLLEQEKEARKRRVGKKNKEDDLDVPEAAPACGKDQDKGKEKKGLQELRQRTTHNAKVASSAAKAMGPLATAETSLTKLLANADGKEGVELMLCEKPIGANLPARCFALTSPSTPMPSATTRNLGSRLLRSCFRLGFCSCLGRSSCRVGRFRLFLGTNLLKEFVEPFLVVSTVSAQSPELTFKRVFPMLR